jgi:hypothetical protein
MENPDIVIVALFAGGSIVLAVLLTIVNSVVYVDPAPVLILRFAAILALLSLWNRWEGDNQRRRIESESHKLGPDAPQQERLFAPSDTQAELILRTAVPFLRD